MSTTPSKVVTADRCMEGDRVEAERDCSKGSWCTREVEAWERSRREENKKKRKKKRRRQSRKTEAACVASAGCNNLLIVYQISTAPRRIAPGTMYEPLAWQQTAAWKETGWKRREIAPGEADVHARWKPKREAEEKRIGRRRRRRRRRRDEDKAVKRKRLV